MSMTIVWSERTKFFIGSIPMFLLLISIFLIPVSMTSLWKNDTFLVILGSVLLLTAIACGLGAVINRPEPTGVETTTMLNVEDFYPAGCVVALVLAAMVFCDLAGIPLRR